MQGAGFGDQSREDPGSRHVRNKNRTPKPQHSDQVLSLVEHEDNGIERVLGEQLSAADNDRNKAQRIREISNQIAPSSFTEKSVHGRDAEGRQSHRDSARNSRESKLCDGPT